MLWGFGGKAPMMMIAAVVLCVACSRASADEPPIPWKPPADPAWEELPKSDDDALAIAQKVASPNQLKPFALGDLASLRADATKLVAGEAAIADAYDAWMNADASKPTYLVFGTLHDSRAQIEAVASIVFRMKAPWGFALEQFRARGKWKGAPGAPSADDADLAKLTHDSGPFDDGAFWRISSRQNELDHAAWKFGYLPSVTNLVYQARGASMPLVGCDMPPELRAGLTGGGAADNAMRELHCARSLRTAAIASAPAHGGEAGLTDDDPMPPERYAILVGANHAAPDGLPRFLQSKQRPARIATVRVLGGRPHDAEGEESLLASRLVVTDPILVRGKTPDSPDMLLLPDDTWGGTIDRASDRGEPRPRPPRVCRSTT